MKRNTRFEISLTIKNRRERFSKANYLNNKAHKKSFDTKIDENGGIYIENKYFSPKDYKKAEKYINNSQPRSLDKWR